MTKKTTILTFPALLIFVLLFLSTPVSAATNWKGKLSSYAKNKNVDCVIFVKCTKDSKAKFEMYKKENDTFQKIISCNAYIGKKGLGKKKQGDMKTPKGTFKIIKSFGIKKNPGTQIKYTKLTKHHYWSAEWKTYNQFIRSKKRIAGEHLIDYKPEYNYCLAINYNPDNICSKGSAIFLHCTGKKKYTAGCVAIPEKYMKQVIINCTENTQICIYKK